jgi:hypothetical protein
MGQNTLDTDPFNGTAGTALVTYSSGNWVNADYTGSYFDHILSTPTGKAQAGGGGLQSVDHRIGQTWTNDQFAQATFDILATSAQFLAVRLGGDGTNISTGYAVGINPNNAGNNNYRIISANAGLNADLVLSATVAAAGDVVNIQIVGTAVTVKVNGTHITDLDFTDSLYATGNPGLITGSDATSRFSNWSAGSVTGGAITVISNSSLIRIPGARRSNMVMV